MGRLEEMEMRFVYNSDQPAMYRVKTLRGFERIIRSILERHGNPYRLFISYKCRHRIKKLADRCFMWDETEETHNGIDVESGEQGFGEPRFDGMSAAIFITNKSVIAFGDARIVAAQMTRGWTYIYCDVYLDERMVSVFEMPVEVFDRIFAQGWQVK